MVSEPEPLVSRFMKYAVWPNVSAEIWPALSASTCLSSSAANWLVDSAVICAVDKAAIWPVSKPWICAVDSPAICADVRLEICSVDSDLMSATDNSAIVFAVEFVFGAFESVLDVKMVMLLLIVTIMAPQQ